MIDNDTVRLLRECTSGARMGIDSLDEVLKKAEGERLRKVLTDARAEHASLLDEAGAALRRFGDEEKEPESIAQSMSWLKTEAALLLDRSDGKIASIITDGCNMGTKSLSKYLNQYAAADEQSKQIAKRLISSEETLADKLREFL